MEEGGKVAGKDALINNPGGGSVHASQKVVAQKVDAQKLDAQTPAKVVVASPQTDIKAAAAPDSDAAVAAEVAASSLKDETAQVKSGDAKEDEKAAAATSSSTLPAVPVKPVAQNEGASPAGAGAAGGAQQGGYLVGEKIQARFSEDGRWYSAVIKNIKDESYQVLYVQYGNLEYLPISSLRRPLPPKNGQQGKANGARGNQAKRPQNKPQPKH